ncbi:C40 family peptidase [Nocardia sp. NPDC127579]|uniref:C40 family peptidase n=1 Tax=Nocardia sp. NPDC127579 TaxID=3345402 RepID=UPI003627222E
MSPELTNDLQGVLRALLGLYGDGQPTAGTATTVAQSMAEDLSERLGTGVAGYLEAHTMRSSVITSHSTKDSIVNRAVADSADWTVAGRGRLNNQIAEFNSRVQAIASVADTRFSGPALLDAARVTIADAAKQVDADTAAARKQAAQIMPPSIPQRERGRGGTASRRYNRSLPRRRRRRPRKSMAFDGTAGGNAVSAASRWLDTPYVWGGGGAGGPSGGGFDCSGLTQYAIAQASNGEVVLPRTTYEQIYAGRRIPSHEVQPGDLVFPAGSWSSRGPEHVQLAAGDGMVIEAPYTGSTVKWSRMPSDAVVVRVLGTQT